MKRLVARMMVLVAIVVMAVPASADDGQIASQIVARLKQQKEAAALKGFDLGVQVDKGTVTMMGQVANSDQAMLALDVARRVPGVKLVVNDLYVKQQRVPTPAIRRTLPAPQPVMQQPVQQLAVQPTPMLPQLAVQPAAAQQPMAAQRSVIANYHQASQAVGSAIAQPQPVQPAVAQRRQLPQRPVAIAQSHLAARGQVTPANYVVDGGYGGGEVVGGSYAGGGEVVGGDYGYGGAVSDNPGVPGYAWPSYAAAPNYGAVSYPQQYSATAWPYIGPFYPYPQVPLGWRKVSLEWDDGWWFLDFTKK